MYDTYTWQKRSLFIRDKPIFSLERMLHKDYDRKCSEKNLLVVSLKGLGAKTNWLALTANRKVTLTLTLQRCDFCAVSAEFL
jgi:hypothetical protein